MGKYQSKPGELTQSELNGWKVGQLINIANELADLVEATQIIANNTNDQARQAKEANRLKRLELEKYQDHYTDSTEYLKDLEDKA